MDLPYGDPKNQKFVTNVGLITSNGPNGQNIMAAEWTHQISYRPGLIAVCIGRSKATRENIDANGCFGVNLAASDQNWIASIAGNSSGRDVDKIAVLKELGAEFYKAKIIDVLMVKNAAMNAECKIVQKVDVGDHPIFIGEVQEASITEKLPLIYSSGKYWQFGERIQKPAQEFLDIVTALITKHWKVQ